MKTIPVKGASVELRGEESRSINQKALARRKIHQAWVNEALTGSFKPGSAARLRQIAAKARAVAA